MTRPTQRTRPGRRPARQGDRREQRERKTRRGMTPSLARGFGRFRLEVVVQKRLFLTTLAPLNHTTHDPALIGTEAMKRTLRSVSGLPRPRFCGGTGRGWKKVLATSGLAWRKDEVVAVGLAIPGRSKSGPDLSMVGFRWLSRRRQVHEKEVFANPGGTKLKRRSAPTATR
jgi:hypothetical protein